MTGSDDATKIEKKKIFSVFASEAVDRNMSRSLSGDLTVFQGDLTDGKNVCVLFLFFSFCCFDTRVREL